MLLTSTTIVKIPRYSPSYGNNVESLLVVLELKTLDGDYTQPPVAVNCDDHLAFLLSDSSSSKCYVHGQYHRTPSDE